MKIGHSVFSIASKSGGVGPVVIGLTSALERHGFAKTITYVPQDDATANENPTQLKSFPCIGSSKYCLNRSLVKLLVDDQIDLLHCHGLWTFLSRTNVQWGAKSRPYVVSPHGMTMPAAMEFSRWKKRLFWPFLERRNLENASCIHALSQAEADSIRKLGITTPICLIGNGVDSQSHLLSDPAVSTASVNPKTMLYLGRLHPIKGVDKLLEAWLSIKQKQSLKEPWRLQIVGWGSEDYDRQLKGFCEANGLTDSVVFSGPLFGDQKHEAMRAAHAFVLPSSSEAFPMAMLEAWSHGLPCVATKTCDVFGDEGHSACNFVDASSEGIENGLLGLASLDDSQRRAMGDKALEIVSRDFTWEVIAEKFARVYGWLLGTESKPDFVQD